jgi:RNA polymerase sigma factor (sigma-70 family)
MDAELAPLISARAVPLPLRLLGDERLARLVGSGQEEAFAVLYQRHHQALYRYCRSLVGRDADAQDALQSAMTGALVALRADRRDAPIRPWLFRIVYNESMTLLRRRRPVAELGEELPALEGSPESVLEQRTRIGRLLADLRELPERQRGALVMRELSGLSHQEVAEALGLSIGAAKQTVFEARRSLQEFDEGRAMACEEIRRLISDGDGRSLRGRRLRAHLRDCAACSAFAGAIPQRQADLRAVAPALPAVAAAGLLMRVTGAGSGQAGGGSAGLVGGAAGKAVAAGVSGKLVATGALIVATAAVGTSGILHAVSAAPPSGHARASVSQPAASRASASGAVGDHRVPGAIRAAATAQPGGLTRTAHHTVSGSGTHARPASSTARSHARHAGGMSHTHGHSAAGVSRSGGTAGGWHLGAQKNPSRQSTGTFKPANPARSGFSQVPANQGGSAVGTARGGSTTARADSGSKASTDRTAVRAPSAARLATHTVRRRAKFSG